MSDCAHQNTRMVWMLVNNFGEPMRVHISRQRRERYHEVRHD